MENETIPAEASTVNGGEPTDQEALLAAQVDTIGDNPQEEPAAAPAVAAAAAVATEPTAEEVAATAAADAAAEAAKVAAAETVVAAAPVAAAPAPAPVAPRDFDAAYAENQRRYDDGEIEGLEYQKEFREITKAESGFTARLEIWAERQRSAAELAVQSFNTVALSWEQANAEFMGNPLRANQMQQAIVAVETRTPGLAPADLFAQAAQIAFEAFNWKAKTPDPAVDAAAIEAAALGERRPAGVPQTLGSAAAAAPIEAQAGNSAFGGLDGKDISSLEDAVARMTKDQQDAYLRDAPGSNSPATNR